MGIPTNYIKMNKYNKQENTIIETFKFELYNSIFLNFGMDKECRDMVSSTIQQAFNNQLGEFKEDNSRIQSLKLISVGIEKKLIGGQLIDLVIARYNAITTKKLYRDWELGFFITKLK